VVRCALVEHGWDWGRVFESADGREEEEGSFVEHGCGVDVGEWLDVFCFYIAEIGDVEESWM